MYAKGSEKQTSEKEINPNFPPTNFTSKYTGWLTFNNFSLGNIQLE